MGLGGEIGMGAVASTVTVGKVSGEGPRLQLKSRAKGGGGGGGGTIRGGGKGVNGESRDTCSNGGLFKTLSTGKKKTQRTILKGQETRPDPTPPEKGVLGGREGNAG